MIAAEFAELKRLIRKAVYANEVAVASCESKRRFNSPEEAGKVLSKKRHHAKLVAYRCQHCRKWHIGNHLGNKSRDMERKAA